jgi:Secretion system C-terminal sorting domain
MNNLSKLAVLGLVAGAINAQAQVKFKVTRSSENMKTYVVSMIPQESLQSSKSITGTMQVTVKVKSENGFVLNKITSLNPEISWDNGSILKSPDGARDYDYISFSLQNMGTKALTFKDGVEVPLFTFQNDGQQADAAVELIDNENDALVKNSHNDFNVQNHVSILGFGHKNAYTGNAFDATGIEQIAQKLRIQKVFPNPAVDKTSIVWENLLDEKAGDLFLTVLDSRNSRELIRKKVSMGTGQFTLDLDLSDLNEGSYLVHIEKDGLRIGTAQKLMVVK